jgi:FtsH-binding integral membrane protein
VVAATPFTHPIPPHRLPQGSDVFGALPRVLAALGSGAGALVVIAGAAWSAARDRRRAAANALIVAGTLVLGAGGVLNSAVGAMNAFSLSLLAGVVLIFVGFLAATSSTPLRASEARVGAASRPSPAGVSPRS